MAVLIGGALALAGCRDREYSVRDATYDASVVTSSGGEVALTDGSSFDFAITSDRFRQWDAARQGLSRAVSKRFGALLNPAAPTERSIARAVSYLASQASARQSIERAGMSVREFVLMTVALEQQMQLAASRGRTHEMVETVPFDSLYGVVPAPPAPYGYPPMPVDSPRTVDTVYLPPLDTFRRDTLLPPSRDTGRLPRRDTILRPRRDTIWFPRRDTTVRPLPPDSVSPPPDTLPRR